MHGGVQIFHEIIRPLHERWHPQSVIDELVLIFECGANTRPHAGALIAPPTPHTLSPHHIVSGVIGATLTVFTIKHITLSDNSLGLLYKAIK